MWRQGTLFSCCVLFAGLAPAVSQAQFPYEGVVAVQSGKLNVHSGPSDAYYRTGQLARDDRVMVVREEPGGWLAIVPPPGSFSWISGEYIREIGPTEGEVTGSGGKVNVRVGTLVNEAVRDEVQVKLSHGAKVRIIERKPSGQGPLAKIWYKIAPPEGEVRYLDGHFIQPVDGRRPGPRPGTSGTNAKPSDPATGEATPKAVKPGAKETDLEPGDEIHPAKPFSNSPRDLLERAQTAYKAMMRKSLLDRDLVSVRTLFEHAAERAQSDVEQVIIARRLEEIQDQEEKRAKIEEFDRIAQRLKERDGVILSTPGKKDAAAEPTPTRFDGNGVLRKSSLTIDGKPAYILASPQGGIRYYVTPSPGIDLKKYLDQTVAVRGAVTFRPEVRAPHIVVRDLTPIEMRR